MKGFTVIYFTLLISFFGVMIGRLRVDRKIIATKYIQATNDLEQVYYTNQLMSAEIAHLEWVIERVHKDQTGEDL